MKIILDNVIFQLQISGGISNYWFQLIKYLMENKVDGLAFFDDRPTENIFRSLLKVGAVAQLGHQSIPLGRYLNPKLGSENTPAIFHSSYYRTSQNKKHINVTTVHDFTYERFIKTPSSLAHKMQKKQAILNSKGIICISENTKKDMLKFVPGSKNHDITVIPHGVSQDAYYILTQDELKTKTVGKFHSKGFLLYVGDRKAAYKNFDKAVKTAEKASFSLVIIGGGNLKPQEIDLLQKAKVNHEHHGNVDNTTLNWFYNSAFALIYPSAYEGFGLPVIEAQMAGCPVIALNASSIPEVAGEAAILVKHNRTDDFVDAVEQLKDNELREKLIQKGLINAKHFTWQNTFERTLDFYNFLMEKHVKG